MNLPKILMLLDAENVSKDRKELLHRIADYSVNSINLRGSVALNFICTHNSRRSQFSQFWTSVLANYYNLPVHSYSGGVEVTACNERTIASIERFGFKVSSSTGNNPTYRIAIDGDKHVKLWSKLFDDKENPTTNFAAIMTCSHADENCPFVTGCEARLSLQYEDPKIYDNTILESAFYDVRSFQIASEINYLLKRIKHDL